MGCTARHGAPSERVIARLIRWSIDNRLLVLLTTVLSAAWGAVSLVRTPLDVPHRDSFLARESLGLLCGRGGALGRLLRSLLRRFHSVFISNLRGAAPLTRRLMKYIITSV